MTLNHPAGRKFPEIFALFNFLWYTLIPGGGEARVAKKKAKTKKKTAKKKKK
jgi:hypothetical protein